MLAWIIKTQVCVTSWNFKLRQITQTRFDNLWYHAKNQIQIQFPKQLAKEDTGSWENKYPLLEAPPSSLTWQKFERGTQGVTSIIFSTAGWFNIREHWSLKSTYWYSWGYKFSSTTAVVNGMVLSVELGNFCQLMVKKISQSYPLKWNFKLKKRRIVQPVWKHLY